MTLIHSDKQIERIERVFDTAKEISKMLAPLPERAQRRLLAYFADLVSDPATDATLAEAEILKQVHEVLGIKR